MGLNFYTCSKQSNIDFIYFTDCDEIIHLASKYSNIICHKISFEEYCDNVSKHLKVDFHPEHAYKLCDLKPFYGFIHQDILRQYEFWGYGDNDLIYGNLNVLTNDNMLNSYDVITTMSERIAGHFAIFRNNEKYRTLGFKCPQWKEHLLSSEHVGFDESDCLGVIEDEEIDDNVDETALIEETGSLGCDKEELFLVTFAFIRAEVNTVVFLG